MRDVNQSINQTAPVTKAGEATPQSEIKIGPTLEEIRCIAKGGMSHIYKAKQPSLDRYIVVKKLKEELVGQPEMLERFRREAKALASVLHQNIAHVYDFVEDGKESYILMEYIDGMDLSSVIEKTGQLPPYVAAAVLLGVAKGVSYIHTHNLVHRDIKPANIRLTNRGEVKLMDFGIVMDIENHGLTRPGTMVGSPSYLSPEQVLGDSITAKADLFLVGICLYEMLTGARPFREEAGETVFQRIRETKYVPVRQMQSAVPAALEQMIERCLEKNPDRRFGSMKELVVALERFLGPLRSSHNEDIILKYLDEEALLTPSISYTEIREKKKTFWSYFSLPVFVACLASFTSALALGYFWGTRHESPAVAPHNNYRPATQMIPSKR